MWSLSLVVRGVDSYAVEICKTVAIHVAPFTLQHLELAWPSKWGQSHCNLLYKQLQKWAWPAYFVLLLWVKRGKGQSHAKSIPC